jgi:hypothetical protein
VVARNLSEIADVFARIAREQRECRTAPVAASAVVDTTSSPLKLRIAEANQPSTNSGPETVEENPTHLLVWLRENRLTSGGKVAEVALQRTVRLSGDGIKIELVHVSGESVLKTVQGHQPFAKAGDTVTQDAFDQTQALHTADTFLKRLAGFGVDLKSVYRDSTGNSGVVRIIANAMSEENAGYVPNANVYVFGTSEGKFHLVSCKEVLVHELAHGYVDHIAPGVNSDTTGEGKPFHEAIGDLFAGLHFENPDISEDLGAYLAQKENTPPGPLRSIKNDVVLDPSIVQEHKRSLAYSGAVWSVTEKLAAKIGKRNACDLMLGGVAKAAFFMTTKSPSSDECVRALLEGIRAHIGTAEPPLVNEVLENLQGEAIRRNIITSPVVLPAPSESAKLFETSLSAIKERSETAFAGIARGLPQLVNRENVGFEVLGDRHFGDVRRVTLRAIVRDPSTSTMIPVEDGQLEVVVQGNNVRYVEGPGLALPEKFDFTNRDGDPRRALARAKKLVAEHLTKEAEHDPSAATVRRGLATLFSDQNLKCRPIFSEGRLNLEVVTLAGEFIVDLEHNSVRTRRLMHVHDVVEHATNAGA